MARAKLTAFVGLNTTGFRRGLRAMRRRWRAFRSTVVAPMARFGRMVGRVFMRAGILMSMALIGAIKHANDFRQQMALVNTMLNGEDLKGYADGILKMSARFGMAKTALTKGLYDILSAGVAAQDGMQFLEVATRAAIGGATDTAVSVDALTTVMNAYGIAAKDAAHVSNILFQVVKDGKITYEELAEHIGKLAPTAKTAGLTLRQLGAAVATIVKTEKPERAMTALRQAMFEAAESGLDLFELAQKFKGGTLEDVIKAGIPKRAAAGVVILANNYKTLNDEIEKFKDVSGRANEAFEKMDKVRFWARAWQTILMYVTRIGSAIDEQLGPAIDFMTRRLNDLAASPAFAAFLARVKSVAKTIAGIMISITKGGRARDLALGGIKNVLLGAFTEGARKAVEILLRAIPFLFKAIAAAAKAATMGAIKGTARLAAAQTVNLKRLKRGEITSADFQSEVKKTIDEWNARDLQKKIDAINEQFELSLGPSVNRLDLGLQMLKEATELAAQELIDFELATEDASDAVKGVTAAEEDPAFQLPVDDFDAGFSNLRKIGANILSGTGPLKPGEKAQKTRQQQLEENKRTNRWLQEMAEDMDDIKNELKQAAPERDVAIF